jgi:hypothetical protein
MINQFETAALLVMNSLDDMNDRVLWATIHAIMHSSRCKNLMVQTEYDRRFLERLVPIANSHRCARVQVPTYNRSMQFCIQCIYFLLTFVHSYIFCSYMLLLWSYFGEYFGCCNRRYAA